MPTAYDYIESNKRKSRWIVASFPISFTLFIYASVLLFFILLGVLSYFQPVNIWSFQSIWRRSVLRAHEICVWLLPMCFAMAVFWAWQAWKQGDQIVLESISRIRPLYKWDAPDVHNLLENLCISSGDYLPQLYILEDNSLNSFAVGMSPMHAGIVLSSGMIKQLNRTQLEGVLAHELAHIRHYDTRLMVILLTCLGFFTFAGELLFYGTEKENLPDEEKLNILALRHIRMPMLSYAGAMLMFYGYFIAPMLRFALSRTRESMADAQAVLLTRYPKGLISALWRISQDSRIEALNGHSLLGAMCIARPGSRGTFFELISGAMRTHPPIEDRILALRKMDGGEGVFRKTS